METHVNLHVTTVWDSAYWSLVVSETDEEGHSETVRHTGGMLPLERSLDTGEGLWDLLRKVGAEMVS